ncbi:MAG: hypothetical protein ABSF10_15395 [Verrucomicrobiota bacterium]|jgi:hypothetical protein
MQTKGNIITGKYISPEKLLDVRWLEKRIEVLKRDGERCQGMDELFQLVCTCAMICSS